MPLHKIYIIGAGPGDPELLTVKAKRLLTQYAEVIIHDRLISKAILDMIPATVEKIYAGKEPELHYMIQDEINLQMVEKAKAGKKVVRLKGGDPFIFGRGGEEAEYLSKHGLEYEVIPGITAAMGAAAENNIPLTYRGVSESVIFITGHNCGEGAPAIDYEFLAKANTTIAIYMGVKNIERIVQELIRYGKDPEISCCSVFDATNSGSKIIYSKLSELPKKNAENHIKNPAIVYIGNVVKISQSLS